MRSRNQLVLPINFEILIEKNDPVWIMTEICDVLDYTELYKTYLKNWRKTDPMVLFEIILFGYMNGIYSSRGIEHACKTDIRFMWLLQGDAAPDHATIARFQNGRLSDVIENLFYQFVTKLFEMSEIQFENLFVDGTKIEANANRYTFVWAKAVEKNLQKLNIKISGELPEICKRYGIVENANIKELISCLENIIKLYGIEFVHGKGKRKNQIQRDYEKLCGYIERINNYRRCLGICGKRKSYSKTDTDATFMRMKEDHMMNGQLKPGYNVQIGVESEYIVAAGLYPNPTDTTTMISFLERLHRNIGRRYTNIIADAGYASEENYTYLEKSGQTAYIKPADHEVKKTRRFKKNIYRMENMTYVESEDCFICPDGRKLEFAYDSRRKSENGYETVKSNYICKSCEGCPHCEKCYKGKYDGRKISFSKTMERQKREAAERIRTEKGKQLRQNRSIQVEGAFGIIKEDQAFRRFLTRGKKKTETQFFLIAFAFNIRKLWNKTQSDRLESHLFKLKTA